MEIFDYIKYIFRLKATDQPNYEYIKGLSLKLCQKFYVKQNIISVLDWIEIPEDEKNKYRSKMLSYFFCCTIPQLKKSNLEKTVEILIYLVVRNESS